jgi:hypothetical protein
MEFEAAVITIKFLLKLSPIINFDHSQDSFTAHQTIFPWSRILFKAKYTTLHSK